MAMPETSCCTCKPVPWFAPSKQPMPEEIRRSIEQQCDKGRYRSVNANLQVGKNVRLIANTFFGEGGGRMFSD